MAKKKNKNLRKKAKRKTTPKKVVKKASKKAKNRKKNNKKHKPKNRSFQKNALLKRSRSAEQVNKKWPIFTLNNEFGSFYELRDLILKSLPAEKDKMVQKINKLGRVRLAVVSGIFINKESVDPFVADLLIVGDDIEARKLRYFLKALEAEVGKEIKFAVMDKEEFEYRLAMFDRFVRVLMEGPHEKLINRLGI